MGNKQDQRRQIRFSIFMKLLLIQLGMAFLVYVVVVLTFGMLWGSRVHRPIVENIKNYASFLIKEMGSPPDQSKAEQLAETYNIEIRYENQDLSWSTSERLPTIEKAKQFSTHHGIIPSSFWHQYYVISGSDGGDFLFRWNFGILETAHTEIFIILLILLLVIFIMMHIFIRRILRPVKWLQQGVNEIGQGNLNVQIPIKKGDELGHLTEAVNNMTQRIRKMIKARDQLLLDVSHELCSPITRMKLALEFIPEVDKKESLRKDLETIEAMITEILETERLEQGHGKLALENHDIVKIMKDVGKEYANKTPGIRWVSLPEKLLLNVDAERIRIVFKNLLDNAFKYSKADSNPVEISIQADNDAAIVKIKDDGPGIPEEDIPQLFEPFYRVDRSRSKKTGGYGLGLSLSKKIMDAHGGMIEITNNKDRGITVTLCFKKH